MDLQTLRQYVQARYASELTDTEIEQHVNEVYKDLAQLFTPDTTAEDLALSTISGTATYTVNANSRRIKEVHLGTSPTSRSRLRSMRYEALMYPRSTGTPARWYPLGMGASIGNVKQQFGLDPIPNSTGTGLTVLYEPEPADLFNDTDTPNYIPEEYHHLIAYGTIAIAASKQQDYNVASAWEQRYRSAYNELMTKLGRTAPSNFPVVSKAGGQ